MGHRHSALAFFCLVHLGWTSVRDSHGNPAAVCNGVERCEDLELWPDPPQPIG